MTTSVNFLITITKMSSSCDKMCVDCVNTHIYRYRLGHPNHVSSAKLNGLIIMMISFKQKIMC